MTLVEHARTELNLLGEDPVYSATLVAAVAAFASFGHSGGSAMTAIQQLHALLQWENLTPLTNDPDEWVDRSEISNAPLWQSNRNSKAMSHDGGRTYTLVDAEPRIVHTSEPAKRG